MTRVATRHLRANVCYVVFKFKGQTIPWQELTWVSEEGNVIENVLEMNKGLVNHLI